MGIKLDWEIESSVKNTGEDGDAARFRRRARFRLLAVVGVVFAILGGCAAVIAWRLSDVENQVRQQLVDTVDAEVATLRIGDLRAFLQFQHTDNPVWMELQRVQFDEYQALKLDSDLQLTGRVLDVDFDSNLQRGRVLVEEIVDGVPYTRVWFYFRFPDEQWRHVEPDYTFWGDQQTLNGERASIIYYEVDSQLATAMQPRLNSWIQNACAALPCDQVLPVTLVILPNPSAQIGWSTDNPWVIQMPSPYTSRARSDQPFELDIQLEVANLLAQRLVAVASNNVEPVYPADAYYLRQAVISWLVGRFVEIETNSFLVSSLAAQYGETAVGVLVQSLQPDSNGLIVTQAAGAASAEQATLDWRDFLTWRLALEDSLIQQRDEANFLALYDTRDETVRLAATNRFTQALQGEQRVVVQAFSEVGTDGSPLLRATVQVGTDGSFRQEEVLFRLVNGLWLRAS